MALSIKKKVSLFYQLLFTGAKILDFDSIWQLSGTASVQFMRIGGEGGGFKRKKNNSCSNLKYYLILEQRVKKFPVFSINSLASPLICPEIFSSLVNPEVTSFFQIQDTMNLCYYFSLIYENLQVLNM